MKFKFLLIAILVVGFTKESFADGFISYKLPFVPLEFIFDDEGVHWESSKTIVTPLGSFTLGYAEYNNQEFDEDYTYVIIEDMNLKKEHIYKINDKKTLKLTSDGRTEIKITKNRVKITLDKGSRFKVSFSVEGKVQESSQLTSTSRWIIPKDSLCISNGGKIEKGLCLSNWNDAKAICRASGGKLPTLHEAERVITDCGGEVEYNSMNFETSSTYQSCYKQKGLTGLGSHWSSTKRSTDNIHAWVYMFYYASVMDDAVKVRNFAVQCIRTRE